MAKVSDAEFEKERAKKHHKEMLDAIKAIKIPQSRDIQPTIVRLDQSIATLTQKLAAMQQPKITVQKTEISQKEVVNSLNELITEIKELRGVIQDDKRVVDERGKEWQFDVVRNQVGFIQSVTVKEV